MIVSHSRFHKMFKPRDQLCIIAVDGFRAKNILCTVSCMLCLGLKNKHLFSS